jgi:glycosyltransferase involved in cell wall biosynthesis
MRILVLIHEFPPIGGGGGAVARDICLGLARRGHEIKILTAHGPGLPRREMLEGIEIMRLRSLRRRPFVAGFDEMAAFVLAGLWAGYRLVRQWRPDVIHAHFAVPAGTAAWALSWLTGIPYVLTAHLGDVPSGVPEKTDRWFRWVLPFTPPIWRNAARVAAVSAFTRDLALRHYDVPITVIPNGVDMETLAAREIRLNDPPRMIFAGRFTEQKSPVQIPRVLAKLRDLSWECLMLGDGALFEDTKREIEQLGLSDRFHLPGWVTPEEVLDGFSHSDILPVAGVQALAKGLAIVAGRAGGFLDLVVPGENGALHEWTDVEGLAASLRALLSDREALRRARENSLALAQKFDLTHIVDSYEQFLKIPRRIFIINSEYPPIGGGAGNASANIARCLSRSSHEITVITARFGDLPHLERTNDVTIHRIPTLRRKQDRSDALEQLAFIAFASLRTIGLARRIKPSATLAFFGMPSGAIAWLLKVVRKIPYVVSLRGGDVPGFRPYDFKVYHELISPFLHVIWHRAVSVTANSNGLRTLASKFDANVPISVIPNGVDLDQFAPQARAWDPPLLLSAGRAVYQKGLDLGLRALAGLKDLPWRWLIAGDGPQMDALQALARELEIADRVTFLGWQAREDLVKKYHAANLFLFPSRHEGMPNAVLEAMASGMPVVATRIAGNEELVLDGETGLLVPPENVDALREALRCILVDANMREKMGSASRRYVADNYSWQRVAEQYAQILDNVN